jgi:DNA-binding HxlR family transcriptional regulator
LKSFSVPQKSVFLPEPLDTKDRQILDVICRYGQKGQSFNKLVDEVKPFVSRSTFATRVERLQRLGYIEKSPDPDRKQVKRKRISEKEKEIAEISEKLAQEYHEDFRKYIREEFMNIGQTFSSVAVAAVTYGETAAGDIFLPSLMENLRNVMLKLASIMKNNPELTQAAFQTEDRQHEEKMKEAEMFFNEFGEELIETIPESMKSQKTIFEKMMKNPELLERLMSTLMTRQS